MLNCFSRVQFFVTFCTVACKDPCLWDSLGSAGMGYFALLLLCPPLPDPRDRTHISYVSGLKLTSLMYLALAFGFFATSATWEALK